MRSAARRMVALAACAVAAGCGGAQRQIVVPASRHVISPAYPTATSMLFVADRAEAAIDVYQTFDLAYDPAPVASILVANGCPYGMAMDKTGMLYVADNCGGNDVEECDKGTTTPVKRITDGISNPLGLAVDQHSRLFVSNDPAAIAIYGRGKTKPSRVISGKPLVNPCGLAVDKHGDLFIADPGAGQVFELVEDGSSVVPLNLRELQQPTGVGIDQASGYLWVTDAATNAIDVYAPGTTAPAATIPGNGSPYAISVQNQGKPKHLVVESDLATNAVYVYDQKHRELQATLNNGIEQPTGLLIENP
jgi:DNA-binding beta-propeller fold protein YncE